MAMSVKAKGRKLFRETTLERCIRQTTMSLHVPDVCKCIPAGFTTYVASYHVLTTGLHSKKNFKILSQKNKSLHQQLVN